MRTARKFIGDKIMRKEGRCNGKDSKFYSKS